MAGVEVTDSSLVGNVVVPFALTEGAEETTAVSVVGNNGGALDDGAGQVEELGHVPLPFTQPSRRW